MTSEGKLPQRSTGREKSRNTNGDGQQSKELLRSVRLVQKASATDSEDTGLRRPAGREKRSGGGNGARLERAYIEKEIKQQGDGFLNGFQEACLQNVYKTELGDSMGQRNVVQKGSLNKFV